MSVPYVFSVEHILHKLNSCIADGSLKKWNPILV